MIVKTYDIQAKISVETYQNGMEDITDQVKRIQITQSINQPAAMFNISLLPTRDRNGSSWYYRLSPMDYVSIAFARHPKNFKTLPPVLRGFVDNVNENVMVDPTTGAPVRTYNLAGRDYGKIFQIAQIYYLVFEAQAIMYQSRMNAAYKVPFSGSPCEIMKSLYEIGYQQLQAVQTTYKTIPLLSWKGNSDILGIIEMYTANSYDGNVWGLMKHIQNAPWNELFIQELEQPTLIFRQTPWLDPSKPDQQIYVQGADSTYGQTLQYIDLTPDDIIQFDITRSDAETRNYFFTRPVTSGLYDQAFEQMAVVGMSGLGSLNSNPYYIPATDEYAGQNRYGFRYFEQASEYFNYVPGMTPSQFDTNAPSWVQFAQKLNENLQKAMARNSALESGMFVLKGNENIKPGYFLKWQNGAYYVETVQHDLSFLNNEVSFKTMAMVTRGTNYLVVKEKLDQFKKAALKDLRAYRSITGRY